MIKKILIANRGEIAVRIVRACAEMGIRSVAIYSDADRHALHVKRADEAYSIGAEPLAGYLNPRKLVNLAVETGCDALHPGYGFLSENAELAEICAERGIKFIGPAADVIRRMGDKTEARRTMIQAGVPVTPGTEGNVADIHEALSEGDRIGYPVMLKATSGGGGRGIRRCNSREELEQNFPRVISEATKAFGSAEVFLEKCIVNPKHIEAQILGDSFGNVVHLFERDCSIQRRNQKLIEIAPSPQLTPEQRAYIGDLAVRAAKAVNYENAGTVEFLLADGEVYFMEMNTRVQVEHTITEEITGIDIVREQIRIASGLPLSVKQEDIQHRGYALQFRINAEDPKNNFLPSFGNVVHLFERDCSIQRRNQKLIEIAPSPQLTPEQRAYIGDLAVRAAKAVNYENAGTVEFLLAEGEVYFMEMNTRVQVEHTITEEITGIDIVREQIRIASGLPLSVKQEDIQHRGYALQFRINAEDPKNNFLPSFGKITRYYAPGGPGVRTDTAIYTGYTIPPYYDSMCLKLVVWALTWEEAMDRGLRALDDMRVQGVKTTAAYYQEILRNPEFRSGQFNTSFVESHPELTNYSIKRKPEELALAIAAAIAAHAGL